jgi:hypothetical protein
MEDLTCKAGWVSGSINFDSLYIAYANYANDLVGFKQFLADQYAQGTPVVVVYALKTATTETVTGQTLQTQAGDNTLTATGSISTLGLSATYTKNIQKPNYVIRNGKLVWADPHIYIDDNGTKTYASANIAPVPSEYNCLPGNVGYTVLGSPTISNGVVSGFSASDYLLATQAYPAEITSYEKNIRFKWANSAGTYQVLFGGTGYDRVIFSSGTWCLLSMRTSSVAIMDMQVGYLPMTVGNWYVLNIKFADNIVTVKLLSDEGAVLFTKTFNFDFINSPNTTLRIGQSTADGGGFFVGSIDLNETYIKINNEVWFTGVGYAPSIGYIDMRSQGFTPAPSGATIGRDE